MLRKTFYIILSLSFLLLLLMSSCSTRKKVSEIKESGTIAELSTAEDVALAISNMDYKDEVPDTVEVVDFDGKKHYFMSQVIDSVGGSVGLVDNLSSALVTTKLRYVAERNGMVTISFNINFPEKGLDPSLQARFAPYLIINKDTINMGDLILTGEKYKKAQIRSNEQYEKFLSKIINDPDIFIKKNQLESFIERNIPELYKLKGDSTLVDEDYYTGLFDISYLEARRHFQNKFKFDRNEKRKRDKEKMYDKYIKSSLIADDIHKDTIVDTEKAFSYTYNTDLKVKPGMKKAELYVDASLFSYGKELYHSPNSAKLTYYITGLLHFADFTPKYIPKIIYRHLSANTQADISFGVAKYEIDRSMGSNNLELRKIEKMVDELLSDKLYDIDSVIVRSSASPEGSYKFNATLSDKRAKSITGYISRYIKSNYSAESNSIEYICRAIPEDWDLLKELIEKDSTLTDKQGVLSLFDYQDYDKREWALSHNKDYNYIKENLYPELRKVNFYFFLHRKGMVKDTIHTTILDTDYSTGLKALSEKEYDKAYRYLRPYRNINSVIAMLSLNYDTEAILTLRGMEESANRDYLLSLAYSRVGKDGDALKSLFAALNKDNSLYMRASLDPEVKRIVKKYGLKQNT